MPETVPPITRVIIGLNVLVYLLQQVIGDTLQNLFALWPMSAPQFGPWQLLTYAFLHEGALLHLGIAHICINMFALFLFGAPLERLWGSGRFTIYYLACVLSAALTELTVENAINSGAAVIGASGGVFGLLLAFGWYFPKEKMGVLIRMPAWLLATVFGVVEMYPMVTGGQQGVARFAHFAHLGGMLGGALTLLYWRMYSRSVS